MIPTKRLLFLFLSVAVLWWCYYTYLFMPDKIRNFYGEIKWSEKTPNVEKTKVVIESAQDEEKISKQEYWQNVVTRLRSSLEVTSNRCSDLAAKIFSNPDTYVDSRVAFFTDPEEVFKVLDQVLNEVFVRKETGKAWMIFRDVADAEMGPDPDELKENLEYSQICLHPHGRNFIETIFEAQKKHHWGPREVKVLEIKLLLWIKKIINEEDYSNEGTLYGLSLIKKMMDYGIITRPIKNEVDQVYLDIFAYEEEFSNDYSDSGKKAKYQIIEDYIDSYRTRFSKDLESIVELLLYSH